MIHLLVFFFFSSRRRHTRWNCDWSSDVCSSDLHMESSSFSGIGMIKVYFHPGATVAGAIAQMNSVAQTVLRIMPPGMQSPNIIDYNAANVPVAQLTVSSDTLPEQELYDYGLNFIRVKLFTIEGLASPAPLGGVSRAVMVNLQPESLYAHGLSPQDVG